MPIKNKIYRLQDSVKNLQSKDFYICLFLFGHNKLAQRKDNKMAFNYSNKFNRILFFQLVLLILFGCQKSYAQERVWTFIGSYRNDTMFAYIDTNTKKQPNGNLLVWEKIVRVDMNYIIGLVEWDCRQKRSRVIQEYSYDLSGEPQDVLNDLGWIYVIDGTFGAGIYKRVCRNSEKTAQSSPTKTSNKILLAEITVSAANLRESPNTNSSVIREVSKKERLILADEKPQGNWYKVIDKESQSEGWLHKTTFKIIQPNKSPPEKKV